MSFAHARHARLPNIPKVDPFAATPPKLSLTLWELLRKRERNGAVVGLMLLVAVRR